MLINMLLPFSVLLLSKFEDWNNNLDASLFGMISFSFFLFRNSNNNLPLGVFFCFCFQSKTGFPETLQKKWEDKPGFQKSGSMHQHVRWSTCVLVYFSLLLDHVIYLKLRRK